MLKPLGDRVFILPSARKEEVRASGIFVPETKDPENRLPEQGRVVAVGPGREKENGTLSTMGVKVGDLVEFHKGYGAEKVKIGGIEHLVIRMEDIVAVEVTE